MTLKELLGKMPPYIDIAIRLPNDNIKIGIVWEFYVGDKKHADYLEREVCLIHPRLPLDLAEKLKIKLKEITLIEVE